MTHEQQEGCLWRCGLGIQSSCSTYGALSVTPASREESVTGSQILKVIGTVDLQSGIGIQSRGTVGDQEWLQVSFSRMQT